MAQLLEEDCRFNSNVTFQLPELRQGAVCVFYRKEKYLAYYYPKHSPNHHRVFLCKAASKEGCIEQAYQHSHVVMAERLGE